MKMTRLTAVTATSGGDAEADVGGTMLEMVPSEGGNQYSSARRRVRASIRCYVDGVQWNALK